MDSEKSINLFGIKKDRLPDYLLHNLSYCQFVNNFWRLLLRKINVLDIVNMVHLFRLFIFHTVFPYERKYW